MKTFIRIVFFLALSLSAFSQSKNNLQKQKKRLLAEIQLSNSILQQTQDDKDLSYEQLKALLQKIAIREQLIRTIQQELSLLQEEIHMNENHGLKLETDLDTLKNDYAKLIQQAYKSGRHFNRLLFLFSSDDFQQAFKRLTYIRQISQYRMLQADAINEKQEELRLALLVLEKQKQFKLNLKEDKELEKNLLKQEKTQQAITVAKLSEKEKQIKKELEQKKKQRKKIQREIEKIIAEELRKNTSTSGGKSYTLTPEAKALSNSFAANKGKLPWPTVKGLVIAKFGKQKHPILSGVTIENNGIEIATEAHETCRSVFKGKVSSIITLPNGLKVVMLRHGEYISVYSNLSDVYVNKGEELDTKEEIGIIFTSKQEGSTVLDFQLWKGSQKQNPQSWLMKK